MGGHALVVGGTGMLRGVSLELAARGWRVTVVARRHKPLAELCRDAAARTGRDDAVSPVAVDYCDIGALALGLRAAVAARGAISLAACYVHSTAAMAPIVIADTVAQPASPCLYLHIVGSQAPDEIEQDLKRDEIALNPGIDYRRIILGFIREGARSRWLTDEEICAGVIRAIEDSRREQVVGTVTPWEERPRE